MIKGAKTIAEYAIRKWLQQKDYDVQYSILKMEGDKGILEDANNNNNTMVLIYDPTDRSVSVEGTT